MPGSLGVNQPFVTLNTGQRMPLLGIGTFMAVTEPNEATVVRMVENALDIGYRHIDTAQNYGTEKAIGMAVKNYADRTSLTRDELFLTTKLWVTNAGRKNAKPALIESLKTLDTPFVDLFLMHYPMAIEPGERRDISGKLIGRDDIDYLDTWQGMEECFELGLAKAIGVSNFNRKQLQRLLDNCRIPPANLQIESHPFLNNSKLIRFSKENGMVASAYSPLAGFDNIYKSTDGKGCPSVFTHPVLLDIAKKRGCTAAQVALQYQLRRGTAVIPKSEKRERLEENFQAMRVELTDEDVCRIDQLDIGMRLCGPADFAHDQKYYPFNEDDYLGDDV